MHRLLSKPGPGVTFRAVLTIILVPSTCTFAVIVWFCPWREEVRAAASVEGESGLGARMKSFLKTRIPEDIPEELVLIECTT